LSNTAISISPRARALSFVAATSVVALICALLILVSRVAQYAENANEGVHVFIEEAPQLQRPQTRSAPPPPRGGVRVAAPDAPPTPTELPVDHAMLARALDCFDRLSRDRREDCPREALEQEYGDGERTRSAYDPSPRRLRLVGSQRAVPPPCQPGVSATTLEGGAPAVQYCGRFGVTPPPPSRSAEEVCVAGGIGPCHPPEFREEDVVRLAHTD
jgi:hypothetical protein